MVRVYVEYAKNIFFTYPDYFMSMVFMSASLALVSIRDVLSNVPKGSFSGLFYFFVSAARNTHWLLQALIAGFVARVIFSGAKIGYKKIRPSLSLKTKLGLIKS